MRTAVECGASTRFGTRHRPGMLRSRTMGLRDLSRTWRLLAACLAALAAWPASALADPTSTSAVEHSLEGRVVDATGRAVAQAEVRIPELGRRLFTDANGAYRFQALTPGRYKVTVSRLGFAPVVHDVEVAGSTSLDISLAQGRRISTMIS